jgi:hypothetical protein
MRNSYATVACGGMDVHYRFSDAVENAPGTSLNAPRPFSIIIALHRGTAAAARPANSKSRIPR